MRTASRKVGVWYKEGYWDRYNRRSFLPPSDNPQTVRHRQYKAGWDARDNEDARHSELTAVPLDQRFDD